MKKNDELFIIKLYMNFLILYYIQKTINEKGINLSLHFFS